MQNSNFSERKKYDQSLKPKKVDPNNPTEEDLKTLKEEYSIAMETLEKLKSQGEKLKTDYERINEVVEKATTKEKKEEDGTTKKLIFNRASQNDEHYKLQTELDQLNSECKILRSKITAVTENQEIKKGIDKLTDLENILTEVKRDSEEVNKTTVKLQEKHKLLTAEIEELETAKGYKAKVDSLKEEIRSYKDKIKEINLKKQTDDREFKIQQEYLTLLEERYRQGCQELGLSASLNFTRAEEQNERNGGKTKPKQQSIPEDMNEANFNQISDELKSLKDSTQKEVREFKSKKAMLESQIIELELQNKDFMEKLKEKKKISNITNKKISEIQRLTNPSLQEMEISSKMIRSSLENYKKPISKHVLDTRKRKTRRDVAGNLDAVDALFFDDADFFEDDLDHKITKVEILHSGGENGRILGLQAFYDLNEREVAGYNPCKIGVEPERIALNLEHDDNLKFLSGFYSEGIDYLRIESEKGLFISHGVVSAREKQQEFHLDVKKDESALTLFTGVNTRKQAASDDDYSLFFIGMEVKRNKPSYVTWHTPKGEEEIEEKIENEELKSRSLRKIFFSRKTVGHKESPPKKK